MQSFRRSVVVLLLCCEVIDAQQAKPLDSDAIDLKLAAFCQNAILQDRGLTCTPFAAPSNRWIVENLLDDVKFRGGFSNSESTADYVDKAALKVQEENTRPRTYATILYAGYRSVLAGKLAPAEMQKLPGVYLRLEGLTALGRAEFGLLFDERKTQEKILDLVEESSKKAQPIYQAIFTGPISEDEFPLYHGALRTISAELDAAILNLLSEEEKSKLWELLEKSKSLNGVVKAAPPR